MRFKFTVRSVSAPPQDFELTASDDAVLSDLVASLINEEAIPAHGRMFCDGKPLDPLTSVAGSEIGSGTVLTSTRTHQPSDSGPLSLHITAGPGAGRVFALPRRSHVIGRGAEADIVVPDVTMSRRHLQLEVGLHSVHVRDLGSTNGSCVEGERVSAEPRLLDTRGRVLAGCSQFAIVDSRPTPALTTRVGGKQIFHRPPQAGCRWRATTHLVPDAPPIGPSPGLSWVSAMIPAGASVVLALLFHAPQLLAFAALGPIAVLSSALTDRRSWRRSGRRQRAEHSARVATVESEIHAALAAEVVYRQRTWPDAAAVRLVASTPGVRLWERHPGDGAFLSLRLGLADYPSETLKTEGGRTQPASTLSMVPATTDLTCGALGVAGPMQVVQALGRWLVGQLATLHAPSDVEIVALLDEKTSASWRWLRWADQHLSAVATSAQERRDLLGQVLDSYDRRRSLPQGHDHGWRGRWTVLVIDPTTTSATLPRLGELLLNGPRFGITAVCLADSPRALPKEVSWAVDLDENGIAGVITGPTLTPGARILTDLVDTEWSDEVARGLARLQEANSDGPKVLGLHTLGSLFDDDPWHPENLRSRWADRPEPIAAIGSTALGPFSIHLTHDGPHVLIAGTTGAGKSELLRTLVASLACAVGPDQLSFVLIDYKGGATFAECADLPHVVGVMTDLDGESTARALISLDAELKRREVCFSRAGVADLESYLGSAEADREPLARLVLVIDEFATLAEELPAFLDGLLSIAQRGRSLGVHLVLATQRPAGVVSAQIKANMALRIALRVTDAAESLDVINSEAASRVGRRSPGRGFARRADGELVEFQTASVTGPVHQEGTIVLRRLDEWNRVLADSAGDGAETELSVIHKAVSKAAAGIRTPRQPWADPLPTQLDVVPTVGSTILHIGLTDDPERQEQEPLALDLRTGSVSVIGRARSGRTTALRTVLCLAASQLRPDELHLHVVDYGGSLKPAAALPHCGTYLDLDRAELVPRLVARLGAELAGRRRRLTAWGMADAREAVNAGHDFPIVMIMVDGWDEFVATNDDADGGRTVDGLLNIMRDGESVGMLVVVAGGRSLLAPRVCSVTARRLLLAQADQIDYTSSGVPPLSVTAGPGRGRDGTNGLLFQIGTIGARTGAAEQWDAAAELIRREPRAAYTAPIRLQPLPELAPLSEIERDQQDIVIGIGGDEGRTVCLDLVGTERQFLISGPAGSGRSTAAMLLAGQLHQRGDELTIIATHRSPLAEWARTRSVSVLGPADKPTSLSGLVVVDDVELFLDTPLGDILQRLVASDEVCAIVTARSEDLLVAFRGLGVEMRRRRTGVLLQPARVDGELLGIRVPPESRRDLPGRGLLVSSQFGSSAVPIQLAMP